MLNSIQHAGLVATSKYANNKILSGDSPSASHCLTGNGRFTQIRPDGQMDRFGRWI
ncbi:hypothetical protein [Rosistilla carotiformis]|uniref:hypothetical protein n=1 Tax=Rosistilla carotiformis TaxID=2528017 RepID=UPI0018D25A64|nr:hypothetical protein [Rosistilla carotiformis]